MRAIVGVVFTVIVLEGCAAKPPETPSAKPTEKPPSSLFTRSQIKRFVDSCVQSGYALRSAEHEACVNRLAKQQLDMMPKAMAAPRVSCRPDASGSVTCT